MATPTSFDESNAVLDRPRDMTDEECGPLCIYRGKYLNGNIVYSCWKLSEEELQEVINTKRIWLGILGFTMTPAYVSGTKPFMDKLNV